jgi:two-component system, NtrC family, sensor kinase
MSFDDILSSLKQASDRNHFPLPEKIDERFIFRSGQAIDRGLYESMQVFSDLSDLKQSLDRASLVLIADETKRLSHANEKFCQRSQYHPAEIVGCAGLFFNAIESYAGFFAEIYVTLESGSTWQGQLQHQAKDGSYYWVDATIVPFLDDLGQLKRCISIQTDITQYKQTENLLTHSLQALRQKPGDRLQSEKWSGLCHLAAGIAHEINNPTNFIYGNLCHLNDAVRSLLSLVQLYQKSYPDANADIQTAIEEMELDFLLEDLPNLLTSLEQGTNRIHEVVNALHTFSNLGGSELKTVDLQAGLDSAISLLQPRLQGQLTGQTPQSEIRVTKVYEILPKVECYPSQLNQALMNLLCNAIESFEPSFILTHPAIVKERRQIEVRLLASDRCATIEIIDNGSGIPDSIQAYIFDPFFTTKPVGQSKGLGLSLAYQIIVGRHGGTLTFESQTGRGTRFVMSIPLRQT